MKKMQSILFLLATTILIFSCTEGVKDQQADRDLLLKSIASSSVYVQLQKTTDQQTFNIATHKYDLKSIIDFMQEHNGISICDMDENVLSQFKGGLVYKELECEIRGIQDDFRAIYYADAIRYNFAGEDFVLMREMYEVNNEVNPLTIEEIIQERTINDVEK